MAKIYLIRHGETPKNKLRIVQPADEPLSETGLAQASQLSKGLASVQFERVLCSDQPRALQTAEAVVSDRGLEITRTPLLREGNFGALRGRSYDDIGFDFFAEDYTPDGGESWDAFHQRVDLAWEAILNVSQQTEGNVLVVTHGLVCRRIVRALCDNPLDFDLPDKFGNTSVSIIDGADPYKLLQVDNTDHLTNDSVSSQTGIV